MYLHQLSLPLVLAAYADLHSILVQRSLLSKVDDVKPTFNFALRFDFEVEPLMMSIGIWVHTHVEIVLGGSDYYNFVKVPALKLRIER